MTPEEKREAYLMARGYCDQSWDDEDAEPCDTCQFMARRTVAERVA